MTDTITYTNTLRICTCWCGIAFALPAHLHKRFIDRQQIHIYCPLGHAMIPAGKSEADRQRDAREAAERQVQRLTAIRTDLETRLEQQRQLTRAQKAAKTRIKNRIAKGVCPCCNRTFENLQRHMTTQHPTYAQESEA